jgi:hypothetical protein
LLSLKHYDHITVSLTNVVAVMERITPRTVFLCNGLSWSRDR